MEILRSTYMIDSNPLFLCFDEETKTYRVGTRWTPVAKFEKIDDAVDAYSVLELLDAPASKDLGRVIRKEMKRAHRDSFDFVTKPMSRINYLIDCVEKRLAGLKPVRCGGKGAVEKWIAA